MALKDAEQLVRARENFVRKRREMVEQMIPPGAAASHFAPNFSGLQEAIEAIDRAIADEKSLPDGYGERLPVDDDLDRPVGGEDNVEHVNFEPK